MLSEHFIDELIAASHKNSEDCAMYLSSALQSELAAHAVSFYTYLRATNRLTLRAQSGFSYSDYDSFELPANTAAGVAIRTESVVSRRIDTSFNRFIFERTKTDPTFGEIHVVPLFDTPRAGVALHLRDQKIFGAACIYPNSEKPVVGAKTLENLSRRMGSLYRHSVETDKSALRGDVVSSTLNSKDVNSFLNKFLSLLSTKWGYEASSVFLHDERNDTLRMRATTGVESGSRLIERFYNVADDESLTVRCFKDRKLIALTDEQAAAKPSRFAEKTLSPHKSILYVPITDPSSTAEVPDVIGVLRTCNKVLSRQEVEETCCHGWEDVEIISFAAEMMGVISHLYTRVDNITLNFERALHGVTRPIKAVQLRLNGIHDFTSNLDLLPKPHDYRLVDSISYINSLEWQVEKHSTREKFSKIEKERVMLYGQVVSKVEAFVRSQFKSYNVDRLEFTSAAASDYRRVPPVYGNVQALQTVFRNLAENALKYHVESKGESTCRLFIGFEIDRTEVRVVFEDHGFGIEDIDLPKLFSEGARSWNAIRRDPTGTGIGLSDSMAIVKQLEGDIVVQSRQSPTRIAVSLKKWSS